MENKQMDMMHHAKIQKMMNDIETMDIDEIMVNLKVLGCTYTYEQLWDQLSQTYNELAVSDHIFETCKIDDSTSPYPKEFIDEALLQIVMRGDFVVDHYGEIIQDIISLMENDMSDKEKMLQLDGVFRRLFKMCRHFKITNFDGMVYQVNDGLDLGSVIIDYLDEWMEHAHTNKELYKQLIAFIDKFFQTFTEVNEYLSASLLFEKAQAYVGMKSKKGEQMFLYMLKNYPDKTEVVLHYALSYIDDDEPKALRIIKKYHHVLSEESESYSIINEILADSTC